MEAKKEVGGFFNARIHATPTEPIYNDQNTTKTSRIHLNNPLLYTIGTYVVVLCYASSPLANVRQL